MRIRSTLVYTVLRLLAFLVPFGIMMLFPVFQELYWLAAVFAAIIGLSLSMLFLRRPLNDMSSGIAERRDARAATHPAKVTDEDVEDAAEDAAHDEPAGHDEPTDAGAPAPRDDQR
ncbi:DUF4229 domain-containing protein [Microbacterium candidum]|uniref:DUF4229 domain-containing protein n=1 Tax=Microbacterium candidum TaxID=3041922 RepID=A0ABT7N4G5_9MICO|nr:DUF4229 domain-containing protein [Microbacterium sp. ASV49]MDL9981588.1 DUF4229 domain-containing protein [Microbacterium sp. ASV49]